MATKKIDAAINPNHLDAPETDSLSLSTSSISPSSPSSPSSSSSPSSPSSPSSSIREDGIIHTPISVIHDTTLCEQRGQIGYFKTYEEEILKLALLSTSQSQNPAVTLTLSPPRLLCNSTKESTDMDKVTHHLHSNKQIESKHVPFITTPPEIMLGIFKLLNPIDAVCFSLMNKYTHNLFRSYGTEGKRPLYNFQPYTQPPLQIGRPESKFPVIPGPNDSCHHCCPVAFFPAHCELHFHLKSFMPSALTFCAGQCQKFTRAEPFDAKSCGVCGRSYRKQFERGRRMINTVRPEGRTYKWYEQPRLDRENRERENRRRLRRLAQG